jgi:hypothetical protein
MNERDQFERCWPWLDASLASFGRTHGKEHVWRRIAEGRAKLWPAEHAVIVTEVNHHPIGYRSLNIWLQGGDLEALLPMHPEVERFALEHKCARLTGGGREGWLRVLDGWEKTFTKRCKWLVEPPPHLRATK